MEGLKPDPATLLRREGEYLTYAQPSLCTVAEVDVTNPVDIQEKKHIISRLHDDPLAGHLGIDKTIELITRTYQ